MTLESLTPEEAAKWRHLSLRAGRAPRHEAGLFGLWWRAMPTPHGLVWRLSLHCGPWAVSLTRQTFAAYRHCTLQLGPYRNS